jgi:CRP/FNR family cyclic AMP-dependent transcriptional regulator
VPETGRQSLEQIKLLEGLPTGVVDELEQQYKWHRVSAHEVVLDRSDPSRDMYFVVAGTVGVVNFSRSGREIAYANVHDGGYFGELAAIDGRPRSATIMAVEDSVVASIPPATFVRLVLDNIDVAMRVMEQLAAIVRSCDDRIMDLSTLREDKRVVRELLRIAAPDPASPGLWTVYSMRTPLDIAARSSTTRETVGRVLTRLGGEGIVEHKAKTLSIRDYEALKTLARETDPEEEAVVSR